MENERKGLTVDEYLAHHGVKGQKWGVRNDPEPSGNNERKQQEDTLKALEDEKKERLKAEKKEAREKRKKIVAAVALTATGLLITKALINRFQAKKGGGRKTTSTKTHTTKSIKNTTAYTTGASYVSQYAGLKLVTKM